MKKVGNNVALRAEPFHRAHRDFFVGLFVLVPVAIIIVVIAYTLSKDQMFKQWFPLRTRYESSYGLIRGSAVTISGIRVGYVEEVELLDNGQAEVQLLLLKNKSHMVRKNSKAILTQENPPVGDWQISLTMGDTTQPLAQEGDYLDAEMPFRIDQLIAQVTSMVLSVERIVFEISEGKGLVGHLLNDDTLVNDVKSIVSQAGDLVKNADKAVQTANRELSSYGRLAKETSATLDTINQAVVSIAPLVQQTDTLLRSINSATTNLPEVVGQLQTDLKEAEQLLRGIQEHPLLRRSVKRAKKKKTEQGAPVP